MHLTELSGYRLFDPQGTRRKLLDLLIEDTADHPPVTGIVYRDAAGQSTMVDARNIALHPEERRIDVGAHYPVSEGNGVHLRRDVIDALVVDIENRRTARVNNLWLEPQSGKLVLTAADISFSGIAGRLIPALDGAGKAENLVDWSGILFLCGDPDRKVAHAAEKLRLFQPSEIAGLLAGLPFLHAAELIGSLSAPLAADVLEATALERQLQIIDELSHDCFRAIVEEMAPDKATDLIANLPQQEIEPLLAEISTAARDRLVDLLAYEPGTVGSEMTNAMVLAIGGWTVAEAREKLKDQLGWPDFAYYLYVVESLQVRKLLGVVTLRSLLQAGDSESLSSIMRAWPLTVSPDEPAKSAAWKLIEANIGAIPVIDDRQQIVGVFTIDRAVQQVAPETWRRNAPRIFS